jgi:hypothetical protein
MFVVEDLPRQDGFGAQSSRDPLLWREEVKGFNDMEDEMNRHQLGNSLEWETVAGGSTPFLHHSDAALDLRDMLVAAGQVEHGATGQGLDQGFDG